jgi:hypothetical protein
MTPTQLSEAAKRQRTNLGLYALRGAIRSTEKRACTASRVRLAIDRGSAQLRHGELAAGERAPAGGAA